MMRSKGKTGRGHPPPDRQFGRGQKRAGGRPKGAIGEKAVVQEIAGELHEIRENGKSAKVTTCELLLKSMRNLAMSADLRAAKWLSDYHRRKIGDPDESGQWLVVPEPMSDDRWIREQMVLNKFRTHPELREDPFFANCRKQNESAQD
jgi:hypothetical protein